MNPAGPGQGCSAYRCLSRHLPWVCFEQARDIAVLVRALVSLQVVAGSAEEEGDFQCGGVGHTGAVKALEAVAQGFVRLSRGVTCRGGTSGLAGVDHRCTVDGCGRRLGVVRLR